jgi:hypothetical protein
MATTDTTTFNLDLVNLVEESFERCGSESRSGYDLKTARRSLNIMLIAWQNRGINLWTVEQGSIPLVSGTATYNLPLDTVDLLDHVVRTGTTTTQVDINISRISVSTYATLPNKNSTGRPLQVYIDRQSGATGPTPTSTISYPTITVWPVPDNDTYTFQYWRLRRIQDAGSGVNTQDVPYRFLPALVAGLAYYLSMKLPEAMPRIPMLKADYEEEFQRAAEEDREKAPLRMVPRQQFI